VGVVGVVVVGLAGQRFEVLGIAIVAMPVILAMVRENELNGSAVVERAMPQPAQGQKHHRDHQEGRQAIPQGHTVVVARERRS
jgi:hypothetical protein